MSALVYTAGDRLRDYSGLCLRWGALLLENPDSGYAVRRRSDLRRVARAHDGDRVTLRSGRGKELAAGSIVGECFTHAAFRDVDGLDLSTLRRVEWHGRPLPELPAEEDRDVSLGMTAKALYDSGMDAEAVGRALRCVAVIRQQGHWYRREAKPSELETITGLVLPLFHALGWSVQLAAVEWRHIDLALFGTTPRSDDNLEAVVEVKKPGMPCLGAFEQAKAYTRPRPGCRRVIVTDGLRYGVYLRAGSEFKLHAYLNLQRMRDRYSIYECGGVVEAMLALRPTGCTRTNN